MSTARKSAKTEKPADAKAGADKTAPANPPVEETAPVKEETPPETVNTPETTGADEPTQTDDHVEEQVTSYKVIGAAVVLRTTDGAERYLYKGATFAEGIFTEESVEHAVTVRLIDQVGQ